MVLSEVTSHQTLRIIDASLNRAGEGLRILEDIARLLLNDTGLTQELKTIRHELIRGDFSLHRQLIQSRDSESDVGIDIEVTGEENVKDLPAVLVANSRRVQEALRTLEELAKTPDLLNMLDTEKFKKARFSLYTIEKKLLSGLIRQDKVRRLSGLYVIIDTQALMGRSHIEVAGQVIKGGARIIQLRDKVLSKSELLSVARELKNLCKEHDVLFIVNDYVDIALDTGADGLHLGQDDLPVPVARKLLPLDTIVGCSTTTVEQAITAQSEGADYIAVGSIYPTSSKTLTTTPARVVGLETLHQVSQAVSVPVVAIGGISRDNIADMITAGAISVAVISAVLGAESPEDASRQLSTGFDINR